MAQEEDFDPDELLREIGDDVDEEYVESEVTEELDFEDQRIRGYEDVITDLDEREGQLNDIEEPEPEPTD